MAEPKLPKIKPGIQPKKAMSSSGVKIGGSKIPIKKPVVENVSTKNLFTNIQRTNPEIRNVRGARTLTNMMSTFGTPENEKIIRKNLQLLRNSLVETFEIAKLLRTSLSTVGDGVGGSGGGSGGSIFAKGLLSIGGGLGIGALWKKLFGRKNKVDDDEDGDDGSDTGKVESDLGQDVKDKINEVNKGIIDLQKGVEKGVTEEIPKPEVVVPEEKEKKDVSEDIQQPSGGGIQLDGLVRLIQGTVSGLGALFRILKSFNLGEQISQNWFGKKKDVQVAKSDTDTDTDTESDTSATTVSNTGQEVAQVASTDLTGILNNSTSPLDGLVSKKVIPPKTADKVKKKLNLSDEDYKQLAYGVSGEAGPGKDKAAVAASILNRVASENFPNNIKDVVHAKTKDGAYEYEALTKGTAVYSEELVNFLKSDEGQKQIIAALETLQGRTDFKGQSQLKNRVASEDPMFDSKGNFYHYFWQGGDGRVKPEDWQMPNYQKFINQSKIDGKKDKDITSILDSRGNKGEFIVLGGNTEKSASQLGSKSNKRIVNTSAPSTSGPTLFFLSPSNDDSSNLVCKSICNIMSG